MNVKGRSAVLSISPGLYDVEQYSHTHWCSEKSGAEIVSLFIIDDDLIHIEVATATSNLLTRPR